MSAQRAIRDAPCHTDASPRGFASLTRATRYVKNDIYGEKDIYGKGHLWRLTLAVGRLQNLPIAKWPAP
jgi:hypothetical protein